MARRKIERSTLVAINAAVKELVDQKSAEELAAYILDNVPIKKLEELLSAE
jgi:hypothetical protein